MKKEKMVILSHIRENARKKLTAISKATGIPISTIFERLKTYQEDCIKAFTCLLDYQKIGFLGAAHIILRVAREHKQQVQDYLTAHRNINSVFRINNGFDFIVEAVFKNINELENFVEGLEDKFKIKSKSVYYIIDEIKRERFMTDPGVVDLLF